MMQIIGLTQAKKMSFHSLSLALGTFDGLHIGHMALIEAVKNADGQSAVLTFDALPIDLFCGDHRPMRLLTLEEKTTMLGQTGIDFLCIAHFDKKFAAIDKNNFVDMLADVFMPVRIIVGYNYTYGCHAEGNADTLMDAGKRLGFEVEVIPPVIYDGEPVSATRARECIAAGNVERAAQLLGYPYSLTGTVGVGRGIGSRMLGYPTANLCIPEEKIIPLRGVYGVGIKMGDEQHQGICNIGVNPTVSSGTRESVEIHILSLDRDIYGQTISVSFNKRVRDEKKFESVDDLKAQIAYDIKSLYGERPAKP